MTPDEVKEKFPEGTLVLIASNMLPNYKKLFGKHGLVVGTAGVFLILDYEHFKDVVYVHYQDVRKVQ